MGHELLKTLFINLKPVTSSAPDGWWNVNLDALLLQNVKGVHRQCPIMTGNSRSCFMEVRGRCALSRFSLWWMQMRVKKWQLLSPLSADPLPRHLMSSSSLLELHYLNITMIWVAPHFPSSTDWWGRGFTLSLSIRVLAPLINNELSIVNLSRSRWAEMRLYIAARLPRLTI